MKISNPKKRKFKKPFSETPNKKLLRSFSEKNNLDPTEIGISSGKLLWFDCIDCGFTFQKSPNTIQSGGSCPHCTGNTFCDKSKECKYCSHRSFYSFEDKSKVNAWSEKNELKPWQVSSGSEIKAWFTCYTPGCGHDFDARIGNILMGQWCPYCSGNKLCSDSLHCDSCLPKTFYSFHDKDKVDSWSNKNEVEPWMTFLHAKNKKIFECKECGHDFETSPDSITKNKGGWCPFCADKKLCSNPLGCNVCISKTFYSSIETYKVNAWSVKNSVYPWGVFKSVKTKFWFDCDICGHDFQISLNNASSGTWCPYCSDNILCEDVKECSVCLPKTFYGSIKAYKVNAWSEKNSFRPWEVFRSSSKKAWFDCVECGHDFESSLNHMATRDTWCPYCSHNKLCPDPRECSVCLSNTFFGTSDQDKVNSWSSKNTFHPWEVFSSTSTSVWFDCNTCGTDFEISLNKVSSDGSWCPDCSIKRNKAIEALVVVLKRVGIDYKLEGAIRLGKKLLYWDAVCKFDGKEFFIESDGPHHFSAKGMTQVSKGSVKGESAILKFNDQRTRDLLKESHIKATNGLLFRFSYRQTGQIESLVDKMIEYVRSGKTGVIYMDDIYW